MTLRAPTSRVTVASYLAAERTADEKSILWDFETFAMAGGSQQHNLLTAAILSEFGAKLKGKPCRTYASDQRVRLPSLARYVYPDASVTCPPVEVDESDTDTICNPRLVVEVLSDSTEAFDRGEKFLAYRSIASLTDYLLVSQHEVRIEHFHRQDEATWVLRTYGPEQVVDIAALGVQLAVSDVFEGIVLVPRPKP